MDYRVATLDDVALPAGMNLQLVRGEPHRNARGRGFLAGRHTEAPS